MPTKWCTDIWATQDIQMMEFRHFDYIFMLVNGCDEQQKLSFR